MKNKFNIDWVYASGTRAVKTMAQTALGMFTVGAALDEITWTHVISVSVVSGLYSILTSLATGIPETKSDGTFQVDTSNEDKDTYMVEFDTHPEDLQKQKYVKLKVSHK